ncbi:MAG: Asp-tRNA(Asn)/Glu-tRNA(Gln) amidotransferase subunit GatA [Pseudomonadota bacterium]
MIQSTIHALLSKLRNKEITSVALVQTYLDEIEKQKELNVYITVCAESALKAANEADKRYANGTERKLEGIPLAFKDLYCTNGVRTTAASKILENFVPFYESTVTQKLLDEGAICIGKTNMDEFAMGSMTQYSHFGPTYNHLKRADGKRLIPGGSSGGSAVAVGAHLAAGSLGSDTGGSIRQPAAFCGVVGIKPTYGLCSRFGMIAFASSLDQAGPMAKDVRDAALLLEIMAGHDPKDSTSLDVPIPSYSGNLKADVKGKNVAVFNECLQDLSADNKKMMDVAIKKLEAGGATIHYVDFPLMKETTPVYYIIAPTEASSNLAKYDGVRFGHRAAGNGDVAKATPNSRAKTRDLSIDELFSKTRQEGFGDEVKRRILMGTYILSKGHYDAYYLRAQKIQGVLRQAFTDLFRNIDVVLAPTTPTPAFALDEIPTDHTSIYLNDLYTTAVNLAGLPAIAFPFGQSESGLPMGCQLIGPELSEQTLFDVGSYLT